MVCAVVSGEECCSVDPDNCCVETFTLALVKGWPRFGVVEQFG